MRYAFLLAFFIALAGRVLALEITIGGQNITADQFLETSDSTLAADCQEQCSGGKAAIAACNGENTCLCNSTTIGMIVQCEQCFFTDLIAKNIKSPDNKAGLASALTAYSSACNNTANIVIPATSLALTLPSDWDGPMSIELTTAQTVVAVIAGGVLGVGALFVVNTM
ncbi:hypothetical protein HETIRDRAFT_440852 [Heterobasidion irregulare TC 32-1]|uniref:Extracellular membrane protein CFEM domain-containing protein n=1 Tax=Heterobasidion irregulare (strain TC 32-1) TaxID=747525 RepID=W4K4B9_HETIT|nr:uncharacterized protein HETIRDRAFT_440852 [Heterobasidion irregulare TC 32-1]ETW79891.1 hypothetical protein HETIRDRAFT_440852 [Heterobasidion irregulare TC 32-1]